MKMIMRKSTKLICALAAVLGSMALLAGCFCLGLLIRRPSPRPVMMVNGQRAGVVTHDDGTSEIWVSDTVYPDGQTTPRYRVYLVATPRFFNVGSDYPYAPRLVDLGGGGAPPTYVYDEPETEGCYRNILVVNRERGVLEQARLGVCVKSSIDRDKTRFIGTSVGYGMYGGGAGTVAVGRYDGAVLTAEHAAPPGLALIGYACDDKRNLFVLWFFDANCGPGPDCGVPVRAVWDVTSGEWSQVTAPKGWEKQAAWSHLGDQTSLPELDILEPTLRAKLEHFWKLSLDSSGGYVLLGGE
jgi:hypothetical protein